MSFSNLRVKSSEISQGSKVLKSHYILFIFKFPDLTMCTIVIYIFYENLVCHFWKTTHKISTFEPLRYYISR